MKRHETPLLWKEATATLLWKEIGRTRMDLNFGLLESGACKQRVEKTAEHLLLEGIVGDNSLIAGVQVGKSTDATSRYT